jgi:hypothetical protein
LLNLFSAHLLDGIDQRGLIGCTYAERADWLTVCSTGVNPTFWRLSSDLIGEFMRLKAQQNQPVRKFSGVLDQGR